MNSKTTQPVICLMGPTASGKTDLALRIADDLPVEIISVDSALIYQGMDIGTGKPSLESRKAVPHHLIDILAPHETYSAAMFIEDARTQIKAIHERGALPLLVGGTMLYFQALQQGIAALPEADSSVREEILGEAQEKGWDAMHSELLRVDPPAGKRIHPNDKQRIQRALEIYRITGQALSVFLKSAQQEVLPYPVCALALEWPRAALHQRIEQRFDAMLAAGFVDEVKKLKEDTRLSLDLPSMRAVGYQQIWRYLDGEYDEATMKQKSLAATRNLAKRQCTWLRAWKGLETIESAKQYEETAEALKHFLRDFPQFQLS